MLQANPIAAPGDAGGKSTPPVIARIPRPIADSRDPGADKSETKPAWTMSRGPRPGAASKRLSPTVLLALVVVIAGLLVVIAMRAGTPDTSAPPPGVQGTSIPQPPVVEMPPIEATAPSSVFSPPAAFAPPASFGPTVDRAAAEAPDVGQGAPRATPPTHPSADATPNADDARWQNAPADADIDREALRRVLPPLDEIRRTGTNPSRNPPRVSEQYPTRPPEGAGSEVRTTDRRNRPGVARFDGMILKPSAQGDR